VIVQYIDISNNLD